MKGPTNAGFITSEKKVDCPIDTFDKKDKDN